MTAAKSSTLKASLFGLITGSALTLLAYTILIPADDGTNTDHNASSEKQPLYWVAPMDANYRRDKPGKSPMGMDLIAYYGGDGAGPDEGAGTIRISANVINNLGVRTVNAEVKTLHTQIDTVGYVTYDEDSLVHIHPRVEGWIEKLYVKAIGDPVKKGQPLYNIYSPELVNAQEEFLLALDRKNRRLITAAENRLVALQLPKSAIKSLKKTRKVQQNITFFSPQNGVIKDLKIREGFFVKPGSTLMSIGDLSQVWVVAEVFERQSNQVAQGTAVTMSLDYLPGKTWQGKIDYVYPILDAKTRTVKVRLRFDNENGEFKPNMFAQIIIHTSSNEKALLIPKEALIRTGNQDRVVLALGEGNFKSVAVSVGRFDSDNVEILSGLSAGEKVVSSAQFLLDSESSKTSDFKRMSHETVPSTAWVDASIISLMPDHKMLTLTHDPIPAWDWPEMTMDFTALDSVDLSQLKTNMTIRVEIERASDNDYRIIKIEQNGEKPVSRATVNGTVTSVMTDHRMVTIDREAIEKWDRAAATVDFTVSDFVDMTLFAVDAYLMFTFEIQDGEFIIVSAMPMKKEMSDEMTKGDK
ncbi:efflux RND transporter periplasmic adaptor subunit [Colwellia psychrerythraea]|uniref:Efflux transporter, RND family, MFP subunit n=1 Tax=Colwellia psychrerythraea TaxID=28229 RepID=A0A099KJ65_COLPS|nr:efflux RND transporter periplasmic adaptor subunit [Colwellia psychrerythraea]KGJ90879.1 efflux transporter, RND family, MFP subunit [Colwellia psychrerythraea]